MISLFDITRFSKIYFTCKETDNSLYISGSAGTLKKACPLSRILPKNKCGDLKYIHNNQITLLNIFRKLHEYLCLTQALKKARNILKHQN